ncbi:MAG: uroporphyrinogen decarboxylase family protein [Thermofilaceae archaeon]|nr:uroporphyrinogen decarboxylase family protein [Thermofilaceae archaeon]MCX8179763.1 uroporphyrinogen decarboxylase family protein [Thermofilaceae archaeon]MDW8004290.1 uroporphyrinogen decarboxylase family protein [Thermofilaceae archaeon]
MDCVELMDPRERLLTALKHEEPDRVPIDLGAMASTGIHAIAYAELKKHLGLGGLLRVYDTGQMLAEPEENVLKLFHVDVLDVARSLDPCGPDWRKWKPWVLPDGTPCEVPEWFNPEPDGAGGWVIRDSNGELVSRMPGSSYYFGGAFSWRGKPQLAKARLEEVDRYPWEAHKVGEAYVELLKRKAEYLYRETSYALMFSTYTGFHEWGQGLRGWSTWLADLTFRRSLASKILDHMLEVNLYNVKRYLEALKEYIQVIEFGDDLGTQVGPQIHPKVYREVLKPYHEELFKYVKKHSRVFVFLHSCGSIYELIPDLIDAGVDVLNPVQISAKGMEPEKLKKEFGEQIAFWGGGCDTQRVLPFATSREVAEHVKRNLEVFKPGGGYVFVQVHNIQPRTPPENVLTMFKTAYDYSWYR